MSWSIPFCLLLQITSNFWEADKASWHWWKNYLALGYPFSVHQEMFCLIFSQITISHWHDRDLLMPSGLQSVMAIPPHSHCKTGCSDHVDLGWPWAQRNAFSPPWEMLGGWGLSKPAPDQSAQTTLLATSYLPFQAKLSRSSLGDLTAEAQALSTLGPLNLPRI